MKNSCHYYMVDMHLFAVNPEPVEGRILHSVVNPEFIEGRVLLSVVILEFIEGRSVIIIKRKRNPKK